MATRESLINQLKSEYPGTLDYVIEVLVDVFLKDPEWIKSEARKLQREDKAVKKPKEKPVMQSIFANVTVE